MSRTTNTLGSYNFVSWNVRGLGAVQKRHRIHAYLLRRKAQIVFFQESHLTDSETQKTRKKWRGKLYSAYSRGATIWIRHGVPFELLEQRRDDQGRYLLLKGNLDGTLIILGNIYAPNSDQDLFYTRVGTALAEWTDIPWILGGDWNAPMDIDLHRSHPPLHGTNASKLAHTLATWAEGCGLTDVWRKLNPTHKEYSFYSPVHKLHTRIDRFLCSNLMTTQATQSTYLAKSFSDHNPLELTLNWGRVPTPVSTWKLQPQLLEDAPFRLALSSTITHYLNENWNTATTRLIEWDALKVVIRGAAIGQVVGARQEIHKQLIDTEQKLNTLERESLTDPLKKLELQQTHIDHADSLETLRVIDYNAYQQRKHTDADKPSTLLAGLVRDRPDPPTITRIRTAQSSIVNTQLEINTAFYQHLKTLYEAPPRVEHNAITGFLQDLPFPSLPNAVKQEINGPITQDELKLAIRSLNRTKVPGIDGLPVEFYTSYSEALVPVLESVFQNSLDEGHLPQSTMEALVTSLLKPGKDALNMYNYRPLSLLPTEYKILSKVLANRIQPYLPTLIHNDQCGFLQNRSTSLNIRRLHHVMQSTSPDHSLAGCLTLDLKQAFDSLSWDFMFATLEKFGFPAGYLKLLRLLYTAPTARAHTGRFISPQYHIFRGTRQGCPLSPFLFVLTLEPLAIALRQSANLLGIPINEQVHLISIYADDILLYLRDLTANNSPLPEIFATFEHASGLTIHQNK